MKFGDIPDILELEKDFDKQNVNLEDLITKRFVPSFAKKSEGGKL